MHLNGIGLYASCCIPAFAPLDIPAYFYTHVPEWETILHCLLYVDFSP